MSLEQANQEFFDKMATRYDHKPWQKKISDQLTAELQNSIAWTGLDVTESESEAQKLRLLDYACGTGMISRAFGPHVAEIRGIDLSGKMVEEFNSRASEAGLPAARIHAVQGSLLDDPPNEDISKPEFFGFDVAAVGLAFHHIDPNAQVTLCKRLAERLKPGGLLLFLDFYQQGKTPTDGLDEWAEDSRKSVTVTGFTEEGMTKVYEEAGLVDFGMREFKDQVFLDLPGKPLYRTCFLSKGRKPLQSDGAIA